MRTTLRILIGEAAPLAILIERPPFVWLAIPPISFVSEDLEDPPLGGVPIESFL